MTKAKPKKPAATPAPVAPENAGKVAVPPSPDLPESAKSPKRVGAAVAAPKGTGKVKESVTFTLKSGATRVFNEEHNGKDFAASADEFAATNAAQIVERVNA